MLRDEPSKTPAGGTLATTTRERLGRYALGRSLGRGGMGEVFRARAFGAEGVVKDLCVKRIRTERLARPGALEQFVAEARLWMRLHHGNIVPVFDFGRAGSEYYLAMEWVDGADVHALLADARTSGEPLPCSTAAHVVAEVARALAYAHAMRDEHGGPVVHRDVKPANVLISRSGDVRLTDFGVATAARGTTARGGTPAYMAPEQLRGEPADARADLYALGVVLHELLSGTRPVNGALTLPATTPEDVTEVAAALLSVDAAARPESAATVARSLEAAVGRARARGDEPAPRDELGRRAARVADRHNAHEEEMSGELSADASFVDPTSEDLPSLTRSTATDAAHTATPPAKRGNPRARRMAVVLAATATLIALSLAIYGALPVRRPAANVEASPRTARIDPRRETGPRPTAVAEDPPAPAPTPTPAPSPRVPNTVARRLEAHAIRTPRAIPALAAEPAVLNVNATPWAAVWIDGVPRGTTPLFGTSLTPGSHELRFVNAPLGVERETTVTLAPGERRDLVVDLAPPRAAAAPPTLTQLAHEK